MLRLIVEKQMNFPVLNFISANLGVAGESRRRRDVTLGEREHSTHGSLVMMHDVDELKAPMTQIKAFLESEGIVFQNKSPQEMRVLVRRRKIRKKHASTLMVHSLRGVSSAKSLGQFKSLIEGMAKDQFGLKSWQCFNAKLLFTEPEITILRHDNECRGVVKGGVCSSCQAVTEGQPNFYVSMMLCDLEDKNSMYNLIGYKAAGEALFGADSTPDSVTALGETHIADVLEEWSEVPINVHAVVEYDIAKGKVRVSPYNLVRMPLDYLTEY